MHVQGIMLKPDVKQLLLTPVYQEQQPNISVLLVILDIPLVLINALKLALIQQHQNHQIVKQHHLANSVLLLEPKHTTIHHVRPAMLDMKQILPENVLILTTVS